MFTLKQAQSVVDDTIVWLGGCNRHTYRSCDTRATPAFLSQVGNYPQARQVGWAVHLAKSQASWSRTACSWAWALRFDARRSACACATCLRYVASDARPLDRPQVGTQRARPDEPLEVRQKEYVQGVSSATRWRAGARPLRAVAAAQWPATRMRSRRPGLLRVARLRDGSAFLQVLTIFACRACAGWETRPTHRSTARAVDATCSRCSASVPNTEGNAALAKGGFWCHRGHVARSPARSTSPPTASSVRVATASVAIRAGSLPRRSRAELAESGAIWR